MPATPSRCFTFKLHAVTSLTPPLLKLERFHAFPAPTTGTSHPGRSDPLWGSSWPPGSGGVVGTCRTVVRTHTACTSVVLCGPVLCTAAPTRAHSHTRGHRERAQPIYSRGELQGPWAGKVSETPPRAKAVDALAVDEVGHPGEELGQGRASVHGGVRQTLERLSDGPYLKGSKRRSLKEEWGVA